ncbi:CU044_5270 family protein [Nonomuraea sp. NPDC050383]|uniref:CU044_5270 family protein n=1 Tax=Nonomuraea sp. NPDC050383 TaxID=3364362 RepID=UPI0037B01850
MNVLDQLRQARPEVLSDSPVDARTRAAELSHAMAQPRPSRRRRKTVRPVWGLGLLGAAAAATAVTVMLTGAGGTAPRAPSATTAAPQPASGRQIHLSAREILLTAAQRAESRREATGAYWHTVGVQRTLFKVDGAGYTVVNSQRSESWTPSAPGGEQWSRASSLGAQPATPQDAEAWRQAGSPAEIRVKVPGKGTVELSTEPRAAEVGHAPLVDGDKVFWLGRNVSMKDLRSLPSTPAGLRKWLLRSYGGHGTESGDPMSSDDWLFAVTAGLIRDMPVTPQVRGAAFRMLADLQNIEVIDDVKDAEGRTGTAIAVKQRVGAKGGDHAVLQSRLIMDETTGQALAQESVVVEPGGLQAGLEPGAVSDSYTILESGWTDSGPAS